MSTNKMSRITWSVGLRKKHLYRKEVSLLILPLHTILFILLLSISSFLSMPLEAAYTLHKGRLVNTDEVATLPADQHFILGANALEKEDWSEAAHQFRIVSCAFPNTSYGQEGLYYLGIAEFQLKEFDAAYDAFSKYLKIPNNSKYFLEAIQYKFAIAEKYKEGAKRRFWGTKQLPKWASGKPKALEIYDEVISAMPSHELTAKALFSKGILLWQEKDFKEAIETFQLLTKRFPKHELAPESYLIINKIYLAQSQAEFQNPDFLALAQINLRKFRQEFPKEPRLLQAEKDLEQIKEVYAKGFYETGLFYERIKQPSASVIYYHNVVQQYPETHVAELCRKRLICLNPSLLAPPESGKTADQNS